MSKGVTCDSNCVVLGLANYTLHSWQQACASTETEHHQQQHVVSAVLWQPSPSNYVKCNLDAALFVTEQMVGMRACLRDETDTFISAMTTKEDVNMSALEAEAWSLHQGLQWVAIIWATER
ncbi:hypothetical protein L195_g051582 [Trifolium pratense]|uniref:RNase H type-1 domain-containing protein n=1 Tax=Trifolium pratense TaxID=57577 RepID=A0A2K3K0D5_TRIPR|nr:hypothetical protein L195_g051582 [Trifolium pratense]